MNSEDTQYERLMVALAELRNRSRPLLEHARGVRQVARELQGADEYAPQERTRSGQPSSADGVTG